MKKILTRIVCIVFFATVINACNSLEFSYWTYPIGTQSAGTNEFMFRYDQAHTYLTGGHVLMKVSYSTEGEGMNSKNNFAKPLGYVNKSTIPKVASQIQPFWQWEHEQYEKPRDWFLRFWQNNKINPNTNPYWQWEHEQYKPRNRPGG